MPDKRWMFREFVRCIKGAAPAVGFIGLTWSWAPRVWDPQCSSSAIDASFMSPTLPPWLSWEENVLSGEVPEAAHGQSFDIEAVATFQMGSKVHQLRAMTSFVVASANETEGEFLDFFYSLLFRSQLILSLFNRSCCSIARRQSSCCDDSSAKFARRRRRRSGR